MMNFDTEKVYNNVRNRFKFGGLSTKGIYLDETVMRMCYTHRRLLSQLAINLVNEEQNEKAMKVLALAEKEIPAYNVPADFQSGSLEIARAYAALDQNAKAQEILDQLWNKSIQYMNWYCTLSGSRFNASSRECMYHLYVLQQELQLAQLLDEKKAETMAAQLQQLAGLYQSKGGNLGF